MGDYFFGSTIWAFNWNPPFDAALKRLAGTGAKGFELTAWSPEMLSYYSPETVSALHGIAKDEGLKLTNFFFNLPFSYATGDKPRRSISSPSNALRTSSRGSARPSSPR